MELEMNQAKEPALGKLYLTGAFVLAGTSVVAARFVTGKLGVFTIALVSMAFALALLVPLCFKKMKETLRMITLRQVLAILVEASKNRFCG